MTPPEYRTQVRQLPRSGRWFVSYWLPYGGFLSADFATWREAMDEACAVERQRDWT